MTKKNLEAFLALVRAGLWEQEVCLLPFGEIDIKEVYRLAEEQSVVGLVAAGLEHIVDIKVPQEVALTFVGNALQSEQRNAAMNKFVAKLIEYLRQKDVYTLLVKGQGIAQCYERPLWRSCGDVDLLLSDKNLRAAKEYLSPLASNVDKEEPYEQHTAMTVDSWSVELHGSLRTGVTTKIDKGIEDLQNSVFYGGNVRSWLNGNTQVFLPSADIDVLFIFTHILKHFFRNGIGLRQICDWCRLLWTYKDSLNHGLLESRIQKMGIMTEWKAFASLAVKYLDMPVEAMPLYSDEEKWKKKAGKILAFIIKTGNFGHNRDTGYSKKYPAPISKLISFYRHTKDSVRYFTIFPMDTVKSWWKMVKFGFRDLKD
jgi:hypothetical protein